MTTPIYDITIECENCGTIYTDSRRDSINLTLSPDFDETDIEDELSAICPMCGQRDYGVGMIIDTRDLS